MIKKIITNTLILVAAVFTYPIVSHSQTIVEQLAAKYPDNYAIFNNYNRETKIFLKDNQPLAETKESVEMLVLDDRANGIYNKYKVYHGSFDELKSLEAFTKVPDGNRYKKVSVPEIKTQSSISHGVFYDDIKESIFDFPSLSKGAFAVVNHVEYNKDCHILSPFYFATYLPIENAKYIVSFPADMDVKYIIRNDEQHSIQVKEDKKGKEHSIEFTASGMRNKEHFDDAPAFSYYEPHVLIQIASYKNDNKETVNYLRNLDDLYQWDYSFIKNINSGREEIIKHLADSLTTKTTTTEEKAKLIYHWVQQNIKYVAFEDGLEGFTPRHAETVCTRKYGDCKDMANLLTTMMQSVGLDAHLTWIGTRRLPYDYTDVPLPIVDNHMISAVQINSKWIFLDATDPNCIYGFPTDEIQGKQALIAISNTEYKVIKVPVMEASNNMVIDTTYIQSSTNGIKGKSSVMYNGYFASTIYDELMFREANEIRDFVKTKMGKASNKFTLNDYTINNQSTDKDQINIAANFEIPDYGKNVSDEYYINLNLEKLVPTSLIDTAKRKVSIKSPYNYVIKQYTIMDIPDTYKVNYLPKNFSIKNEWITLEINYSIANNKVIAKQELHNNFIMLYPKDFEKWNSSVKEISKQYKEQVVFEKAK